LSPTPILKSQEIRISHSATTVIQQAIWFVTEQPEWKQFNGYKIICFVRMRDKQNDFMIFCKFRRINSENIRKQYNTLLCLVPRFYWWKTKLPVIPITRFLNATINSTLRAAIQKAKYHFKRLTTLSVGVM
jgi:hypothetical protein